MKHFHAVADHFSVEAPEPPAPFRGRARSVSGVKIQRRSFRRREALVREEPVLVLGIVCRQGFGELPRVTPYATGGHGQRSGIEGGYHSGYKESVGYLTWAMTI